MNLCFSSNTHKLYHVSHAHHQRCSETNRTVHVSRSLCEELRRGEERRGESSVKEKEKRQRTSRNRSEEEEEDMSGGGGDGPKLYNNKPKKSQLKQSQKVRDMSTPPPTPNPINPSPPPSPPPPPTSSTLPPHKESFARRYKFIWPLLLTVNLAIGAYIFVRAKKKDPSTEDVEVAVEIPSTPVASTTASVTAPEKPYIQPIITEPVKVQQVIPEKQQRELYKWMLEEKRKVKPKNSEEKKKLDEEKALLKQVLRSKSLPNI